MVKYFHFHPSNDPDDNFDAQLETQRCDYHIIRNNRTRRCKRHVIIGLPYCHSHMKKAMHLECKRSSINGAGLGLFAYSPSKDKKPSIVFKKNAFICEYNGEIIDKDELEERYHDFTAPYAIQVTRTRFEDGALERSVGSLINHKPVPRSNCKFAIHKTQGQHRVYLKASKNIKHGDELFVSYGRSYRFNEPANFGTNNNKYKL